MRKILFIFIFIFLSCEDKDNCTECMLFHLENSNSIVLPDPLNPNPNIILFQETYTSKTNSVYEIRNNSQCYVNIYDYASDPEQGGDSRVEELVRKSSLSNLNSFVLPPGCKAFILKPQDNSLPIDFHVGINPVNNSLSTYNFNYWRSEANGCKNSITEFPGGCNVNSISWGGTSGEIIQIGP